MDCVTQPEPIIIMIISKHFNFLFIKPSNMYFP